MTINLTAEFVGAVVTYIRSRQVIGRRAAKAELIARMGSDVREVAVAAADKSW